MSALPALLMRERVNALQESMRTLPQMECKTNHYFADSMYARELYQEKDSLVVGKIHKREHFFIVLKGSIKVVLDDVIRTLTAPTVIVSKPGAKRAILALEDTIYMTVHKTKKRNLDKIEQEIIEEDKRALFDSSNHITTVSCGLMSLTTER